MRNKRREGKKAEEGEEEGKENNMRTYLGLTYLLSKSKVISAMDFRDTCRHCQ